MTTIISEIDTRFNKIMGYGVEIEISPRINFLNAKYYDLMDKTNEEIIESWDIDTCMKYVKILKNYKIIVESKKNSYLDMSFKMEMDTNKNVLQCYDKILINLNKNISKMHLIGLSNN